ncbi:MAG: galactokinase [Actinobacteria bacterium]|nr:galactokinase [Actinomycetota bacterium]
MIVTRAPLRLPLGGGGTDIVSYASRFGGFVLSSAIDKFIYISVNRPQADDFIRLKYSRSETVSTVDDIQNELIREALKLTGIDKGIEITAMADVPDGTGLGSSGAFLVALLLALHTFKKESVPAEVLAKEAATIEIDILGHPIGKHDQYVAAFGGLVALEIGRDNVVDVRATNISPEVVREMENHLTLFYTGRIRRSVEVLRKQDNSTKINDSRVIDSLHEIKEVGIRIKTLLEEERIENLGALFDAHWQAKIKLSDAIADREIIDLYGLAKANGAEGGKLVGAGGGGFMAFFANGSMLKLRSVLVSEGLRELPFRFEPEGAKVLVDF